MLARVFVLLTLFCGLLSMASSAQAEPGALAPPSYEGFANWTRGPSYCLGANPSCGRDPWWLQWNELQSGDLAQFAHTQSPLTVEARYLEALNLLWEWNEGQELIRNGSDFGVIIESGVFDREPTAIASYNTSRRRISINPGYAPAATWMLAAVLSHELRHISDAHLRAFQGHVTEDCFARETRAYETEARFIHWLSSSMMGGPLPIRELRQQTPPEMRGLSDLLIRISSAPNASELVRRDYAELCVRNP
ncbi:MAG: hypothetical protein ACKVVP_00050 [Chloroflexota bacterium]